MEKKLLNRAKKLGFNVYQNKLGKWVIKGVVGKKIWMLQEQRANSWLMTFDDFAQVFLSTEKSISALNLLIKHTQELQKG